MIDVVAHATELKESYTYADYLFWDTEERYEIIDGAAYAMAAPTLAHQIICGEIFAIIRDYLKGKPCRVLIAPFDVRLFPKADKSDTTVVQPDILVVCDKSKLADGKACKGEPDFVIEVLSPGSAIMDRNVKLEVYRRAGVKEYWIVNTDTLEIQVNLLSNGRYVTRVYKDRVPCSVLPGLVINLDDVRARVNS